MTLAHQDFGSNVTRAAPVQPSETVHAYAVRLGSVIPPMQTGVPTPTNPMHTLTDPFDCFVGYTQSGPALQVPFAGLAPGLIGIYQVDVQTPSPLPSQDFLLNCGTPGEAAERQAGFVFVPPQQ